MTSSQDIDTINSPNLDPDPSEEPSINPLDELPGEVEMSIFDHLEELRQRIFYSLIVVVFYRRQTPSTITGSSCSRR
jgi:sec-independent protein translocase protein TatC